MTESNDKEILHRRALALARPNTPLAEPAEQREVLLFSIRAEVYGMEARYSRELFAMKHYTPVPATPPWVMGVTSIHGEILSLVDLGRFFEQPSLALTNLNKVIVVDSGALTFGIVIDEPLGIRRIPVEELHEPPFAAGDSRAPYIAGVTADNVIVLDMTALMNSRRIVVGGGGGPAAAAGDST